MWSCRHNSRWGTLHTHTHRAKRKLGRVTEGDREVCLPTLKYNHKTADGQETSGPRRHTAAEGPEENWGRFLF